MFKNCIKLLSEDWQVYPKKLPNISSASNILKESQSNVDLGAYKGADVDKYIFRQNQTRNFRRRSITNDKSTNKYDHN